MNGMKNIISRIFFEIIISSSSSHFETKIFGLENTGSLDLFTKLENVTFLVLHTADHPCDLI